MGRVDEGLGEVLGAGAAEEEGVAVGDFVHLLGDGFFDGGVAMSDTGDSGATGGVAVGECGVSIFVGIGFWEGVGGWGSFPAYS